MNARQRLEELGLSPHETAIYLALLSHGEMPASVLAKHVSLQRTTAYAILKTMIAKGYASSTLKRRHQLFRAEPPRALAHAYEHRLRSFTEGLPLLESLEKKIRPERRRAIYRNIKRTQAILSNHSAGVSSSLLLDHWE